MRKILIVVGFLLLSMGAQAQFEKGTWMVNPSISGLELSWNKDSKAKFGFGVQGGAFLVDNVVLLVDGEALWTSPVDVYSLGVGGRYYFNDIGVYMGAGLYGSRINPKVGSNVNNFSLKLEVGYAFFLSKTVTIEPALYYNQSFKDSDYTELGLKLGFGFYF